MQAKSKIVVFTIWHFTEKNLSTTNLRCLKIKQQDDDLEKNTFHQFLFMSPQKSKKIKIGK